jgi:spermidine synthase
VRADRQSAPPARIFLFASLLFFSSGLTALVYQVMWMRGFGLVFGSTTRAASAVLAAFFFGMAVGNWLGGRLARGRSRALVLYGVAEAVIGAGALGVLFWLALYGELYPAIYQWRAGGAGLTAVQLVMAFLAMAPPCVAMGATLPLISQAVVEGRADLGRRTSAIYGLNTLGAVFGVLLSGFLLPIWIGARGSVMLAAVINLGIGAAAWVFARRLARVEAGGDGVRPPVGLGTALEPEPASGPSQLPRSSPVAPEPGGRDERLDPLIRWVVVISGFGTLALEVLYTRLLVNTTDSSVYSFAVMLATFLVALALGSFFVSAVVDRMTSPWRLVAWSSAGACLAVLISPSVFSSVESIAFGGEGRSYLAGLFRLSALTIGPPAVLVAIALPTAWKLSIRHAEETGGRIGGLTSLNTLAAVAGSLSAGFLILPTLGLSAGILLVALLYAALAVIGFARAGRGASRWGPMAALVAGLALLLAWQSWQVMPLQLRPGEQILHYYDGESGTVAVTRRGNGVLTLRINNRYGLGNSGTKAVRMQRGQGRLGMLLARDARSAAFIGVATGISLSAVAQVPALERVLAIELVPGVLEAATRFDEHNLGVLGDPRVELVVADGRNHLRGVDERFDVIVGDLFVPWHAGTGYLYTAEHFASVAERLTGGGVFVQWLQAAQLSLGELKVLLATFSDVFPEMDLCRIVDSKLIGLVGYGPAGRGRPELRERRLAGSEFACIDWVGADWSAGVPRNRDDFPVIEFSTAGSHLDRSPERVAQVKRHLTELFGEKPWDR